MSDVADEQDAEETEVAEVVDLFNSPEDVLAYYQMRLRVPKGQRNDFGKYDYRNLEDINDAFKRVQAELWEKFGILTSLHYPEDHVRMVDGMLKRDVVVRLQTPYGPVSSEMSVREPDKQGGMSLSQISGSSSSYARKYAVQGLFALGGESDPDELPPAVEDRFPSGKFDVRCRRCGNRGYGFTENTATHERCATCGAIDWEPV